MPSRPWRAQGRFDAPQPGRSRERGRRSTAESWARRPAILLVVIGARAVRGPPPGLRGGAGRADGRSTSGAWAGTARSTSGPIRPLVGAEPGAGPAGARAARDPDVVDPREPADGRRRGADLGLPDARPAGARVADEPGRTAPLERLPAEDPSRRRGAPGDRGGRPDPRPVRDVPHRPDVGRAALPGWADARRSTIRPWPAGSIGADWVARQGPEWRRSLVWRPQAEPARAWFVPLTAGRSDDDPGVRVGRPDALSSTCSGGRRRWRSGRRRPERLEVDGRRRRARRWSSSRSSPTRSGGPLDRAGRASDRPAIVPVFRASAKAGWQAVTVPGPGDGPCGWSIAAGDVRDGLAVSALAWCGWGSWPDRGFGRGPHPSTEAKR